MDGNEISVLAARYGRDLERFFAGKVGCPHAAADLAQETFLRLTARPPGPVVENPRAYLFRAASNLLVDYLRTSRRTRERFSAGPPSVEAPDGAPGPERRLLSARDVARLEAAIGELPPRCREVFLLHKFDGLSYAEVAERLGIARNTVVVHMVKALAYCRERLA